MGLKSRISHALLNATKGSRWYTETMFPDCRKFWELETFNLEVVNLGSTSGVHAFDYAGVPVRGANWALRRNYLSGDRAVLENYLSFLKPGATVIVTLCPFSSLSGGYALSDDRYYSILYPSSLPAFSKVRQMAVADIQKNPVRYIPAFQVYLELRRKLARIVHRAQPVPLSEAELERNARTWLADWLREFGLRDLSSPFSLVNRDGLADAVGHLDAIVAICRDHGFRPTLVLPPMHRSLAEKFDSNARQRLVGDMVQALAEKDVLFLNYIDDAEFTSDATLFENAYLLNAAGARKFTRRVLKDLDLI